MVLEIKVKVPDALNEPSKVSSMNEFFNMFFQVIIVFHVMVVILVEVIVFGSISFLQQNLHWLKVF